MICIACGHVAKISSVELEHPELYKRGPKIVPMVMDKEGADALKPDSVQVGRSTNWRDDALAELKKLIRQVETIEKAKTDARTIYKALRLLGVEMPNPPHWIDSGLVRDATVCNTCGKKLVHSGQYHRLSTTEVICRPCNTAAKRT